MPSGWRLTSLGSEVSLAGLEQVANELLAHAGKRTVLLFYGEMGSGKTTLIKAIARQLGVKETMSSPTFSIVNEYRASTTTVYHLDLYRLKNEQELIDIGVEEYFDSGNYCLVEWPEKLGRLLPADTLQVRITPIDTSHRRIEYQAV
ncbi:MAG: tRNA (adenosine(37)-N6)-threonylcarbamoyltransferase complex ATPase subunit type 1 TsaE [Cyclobacteriaceae bacterium]|nr:tRNA (adenosine(37)-N6)-threonylcarbamoyltransferase complex ATPase subunit type 1 TsaE [Cyclobacteriaceae bacterium]